MRFRNLRSLWDEEKYGSSPYRPYRTRLVGTFEGDVGFMPGFPTSVLCVVIPKPNLWVDLLLVIEPRGRMQLSVLCYFLFQLESAGKTAGGARAVSTSVADRVVYLL